MAALDVQKELDSVDAVLRRCCICDTSGEKWTEFESIADKSMHRTGASIAELGERYLGEVALAAWAILDDKDQKLTFQDVEKWLRRHESPIWFVGTPNPSSDITRAMHRDGSAAAYTLHVIVRPQEDAMREIVAMSGSYAQNFARLADTGMMVVKSVEVKN